MQKPVQPGKGGSFFSLSHAGTSSAISEFLAEVDSNVEVQNAVK